MMNTSLPHDAKIPARIRELHHQALAVSAKYRAAEIELLNVLDLVDRHRVFLRYGYNSLFQYAVQSLKLSENVAYTFINVTRKSREVPALKAEIKNGTLTVSKAKKIAAVLTRENSQHWLELAKTSSQAKIEREVALAHPQAPTGRMTYVAAAAEIAEKVTVPVGLFTEHGRVPRVQLQVGISEKLMIKLRRAQDLVSQKSRGAANLENTLEAMVDLFLQKHDPIAKAQRQVMRGKLVAEVSAQEIGQELVHKNGQSACANEGLTTSETAAATADQQVLRPVASANLQKSLRKPLSAQTKHRVMLKFAGRCSHVDHQGRSCRETKFLEIHHVRPVSAGGTDQLENLALLCSGHHRGRHLTESGT